MHVLIVGHKGQLGTELMHCLETGRNELGTIPDVYRGVKVTGADIDTLDITCQGAVLRFVEACQPDAIINCAAYTNVDGCESHEQDAFLANAIGPRNLAIAAEAVHAKLLHVSTDYVFDGTESSPRNEYDLPHPVSVYGKTKFLGETYVREFCKRWFIVRTAWLYGYYGKNFVKSIMKKCMDTGTATVVNDQFGNPTNAADLAYHLLKILATEEYGVYHCTGNGECSWYDFAKEIVRLSGIQATVLPCSSDVYQSPTKRPAYSALNHMMLKATVGDEMRPWQEALKCYFAHLQEESR